MKQQDAEFSEKSDVFLPSEAETEMCKNLSERGEPMFCLSGILGTPVQLVF